jgi:hypothetical protein
MARFKIQRNRIKEGVSIARYNTHKLGYERQRRSSTGSGDSVIMRSTQVYIGPSVEGPDVEYIARVGGKVSDRMPSFVVPRK